MQGFAKTVTNYYSTPLHKTAQINVSLEYICQLYHSLKLIGSIYIFTFGVLGNLSITRTDYSIL